MNNRSVTALKTAVVICIALAVGAGIAMPWLIKWYAALRNIAASAQTAIMISYYVCLVPAVTALCAMLGILRHIGRRHPFDMKNIAYLTLISICCLAVALTCIIGGIWYPPLFFVSAAMVFLFLTVRVISSCFIAASVLQEDSDLTV